MKSENVSLAQEVDITDELFGETAIESNGLKSAQ